MLADGLGVLRLRDPGGARCDARGGDGRATRSRATTASREQNAGHPRDPDPVMRFKNPLDGTVAWDDKVKGRIEIGNDELDDW